MWTYVNGVLKVDTFARSNAEAMYLAQTVVNHLPQISGSEGPVKYYFNLLQGSCASSNTDEFGQRSNLYTDPCYQLFESQEHVLVTLNGALRDRTFEETLRETEKALARLASRLWVTECLVSVSDNSQSFVFNNPDWIINMEIGNWVSRMLGNPEE